ncbi:MAG: ATP-binding protein [Planctomycetaceae bacterium]
MRSKLFWKIAGLYVLLSVPAMIGLIASVVSQLSSQGKLLHERECQALLKQIAADIGTSENIPGALRGWQPKLNSGQKVWVTNAAGINLGEPQSEAVKDIALESVIRTALETGQAARQIRLGSSFDDVLALAVRAETRSGSVAGVVSEPIVVIMVSDSALANSTVSQLTTTAVRTATYTWLLTGLCLCLVAAGVVAPLQAMSLKLQTSVMRNEREDMLLSVSDRRDEVGQVASALYVLEDELQDRIQSLEKVGQEATAAADLLTAVLESMIEGVIAIDLDQKIVYLNQGARKLLSIGDAIRPGHRLYEAVRIPAFLETIEESLSARRALTLEYRAPRDKAHHVLSVTPIVHSSYAGAVAVVRDISEMRKLEAMRRDFVSGVSHELKTPLTVIQACTDTLLGGAMSDPEASLRFLKQIEEQSERLLQLILGMLQLARVESGQEVLHFEDLDGVDIVEDVIHDFLPVATSRGVELVRTGPDSLPIHTDEQSLRTIMSNLVDNAIKHTDAGGKVTVELTMVGRGPCFAVRDTGVGIPEELLGRIFERFYRVEKDRSRSRGGSGLGLAIVKHLCLAIKATIGVQSRLGEGSCFKVQFPG